LGAKGGTPTEKGERTSRMEASLESQLAGLAQQPLSHAAPTETRAQIAPRRSHDAFSSCPPVWSWTCES